MDKYRPKGWENPWDIDNWDLDLSTLMCTRAFLNGYEVIPDNDRSNRQSEYEAGADAILEGLIKEHEVYIDGQLSLEGGDSAYDGKRGYIVFISDEK